MWKKQIWSVTQSLSVHHEVQESTLWSRPPKRQMYGSISSPRRASASTLVLKTPSFPGWKSNLWALPKHTSRHRYADGGVHSIWCNILQATYRWSYLAKNSHVELICVGYKVQGISGIKKHTQKYTNILYIYKTFMARTALNDNRNIPLAGTSPMATCISKKGYLKSTSCQSYCFSWASEKCSLSLFL